MFGLKLSPMFGAAAMSLSSFFVVTNALRLRFFHVLKKPAAKEQIETEGTVKQGRTLPENKEEIKMITMKIEGMMCPHCQAAVTKALNAVEGVKKTDVSLDDKAAYVEAVDGVSEDALKKAVVDAGYEVTEITMQ